MAEIVNRRICIGIWLLAGITKAGSKKTTTKKKG